MAPDFPFDPWLDRWGLIKDGEGFATKFGSRLLPVLKDGAPAMLKIAGSDEERHGAALMAWYAGRGAAPVLAREGDALLLRRLVGARSLADMARGGEDDEASLILCRAAEQLHAARNELPPASLVPLQVWFRALDPVAAAEGGIFAVASTAARHLLDTPRDVVVLHGDYHHDNLLDAGEGRWLAIDPKGLIGERGFEFANLFRNPDAATALKPGRLARQLDIVTGGANLEPMRLLQWIVAYAGLGAAWSLGSGHRDDAKVGMEIAEIAAAELQRRGG